MARRQRSRATVGDHQRRFALHHHLHVMHRRIRHAIGPLAQFVRRLVLGGVPAADGEIHAADESDGVVHADDFLMVSAIERMLAVKPHLDTRMFFPFRAQQERQRGAGRVQHRHAPYQHADLQLRIFLHQCAQ